MTDLLYAAAQALDPLGDAEAQRGITKNFAKVGSSRPSSLLYTYGPGSIMDLPAFTIMPAGLDDWDKIWTRRNGHPTVHAPRLLEVVRDVLGDQVAELRPFPSQPARAFSREGDDLGVPARVFPQWLRCTGCGLLAPLTHFDYRNTHPYRPDQARFDHENCRGRSGRGRAGGTKAARRQAVAARYLLVCPAGHADEFPYQLWVHRGKPCEKAEFPALRMEESSAGRGASGTVVCLSCDLRRSMSEAQGEAGRAKLPRCRGRHPHLGAFEPDGCGNETRLMLIGASNLWFPATQAIIVMPQSRAETTLDLADQVRREIGDDLPEIHSQLGLVRMVLRRTPLAEVADLADDRLAEVVARALQPPRTDDQRQEKLRAWDPVDLLVPEWQYLQRDPLGQKHDDPSGLVLSARARGAALPASVSRVLAVDKLRRVNALVGFTRVDELDRVSDDDRRLRLVPLTRDRRPTWTVATEDRGEGIFLQLDEVAVAAWEARIEAGPLWAAHRQAHRRNFQRRFSETAAAIDPDTRLRPPRYWLLHTLSHVLIRELAMRSGYSAASLSERVYAWQAAPGREPAAGLLLCTTASDSDGTLGGLVELSKPDTLAATVNRALSRAARCSSDPVCATRTPRDPEDFLHGAACHCCAMASETSCERANRFLDRRFLIDLPGSRDGFFS